MRKPDLPNVVSLSRLPLAAAIWLRPASVGWLATLIAVAAFSDLLDGWLSRRRAATHPEEAGARHTGEWLDPLCDKIFIASLAAAIFVVRQPGWWPAVLVLTRDVLLPVLLVIRAVVPSARFLPIQFRARVPGKLATAAQYAAAIVLFFVPRWFVVAAYGAAVFGLAALADYMFHELGRYQAARQKPG